MTRMRWTQQGVCICELTAAGTACMNSGKAQARRNSSMKGEGDHDVPTLAEGLIGNGSLLGEGKLFLYCFKVWSLVYQLHACGRPRIQEHMGNTNLTWYLRRGRHNTR